MKGEESFYGHILPKQCVLVTRVMLREGPRYCVHLICIFCVSYFLNHGMKGGLQITDVQSKT
jgi:hypothetical protein